MDNIAHLVSNFYMVLSLSMDFSYISNTKILKKKKNPIFLPPPPLGGGY